MTPDEKCPGCDNTGGAVIGSEWEFVREGEGFYSPIMDYCQCVIGQALKKQHELREAAQFFGEVADHFEELAARAADEEAARIDCGGGW
ncbi:MAG: hypothetical protein ACLGIN_17095 [Candidatus Sericytochromatia bacterium]